MRSGTKDAGERRRRQRGIVPIAALLAIGLAGCATSGVGSGRLEAPGKPGDEGEVAFRWSTGADRTEGDISAVLPDGRRFEGRFLQITSQTVAQDLNAWSPLGSPYYGGWRGGAYWEPVDATGFVTRYSGRVIAQLEGPSGEQMRCEFVLEDPVSGPDGGGLGGCQLSSGDRIEFARLVGE